MNKAVYTSTVLLFFSTVFIHLPLSSEIYRWVDNQGQVHFSDARNKPGYVNETERIEVEPNVIEVRPGQTPTQKRSVKKEKSGKSVTMSSTWRGHKSNDRKCTRAREKLENVRSRMRAGYTAAQQRKLHDRELRYMEERSRYCD